MRCIRCPTAYHSACLQSADIRRLDPSGRVILCEKHDQSALPPPYVAPLGQAAPSSRDPRLAAAGPALPAALPPQQDTQPPPSQTDTSRPDPALSSAGTHSAQPGGIPLDRGMDPNGTAKPSQAAPKADPGSEGVSQPVSVLSLAYATAAQDQSRGSEDVAASGGGQAPPGTQ